MGNLVVAPPLLALFIFVQKRYYPMMILLYFLFFDRSSATSTMPLLLYLLLKKAFLLISTLNQVFLGFCDVRGWRTVSLSLFSMCCVCESFTISPFLLRKSSFQIPIYSISNFISFELHSISNFNSIPTGSSIPSSNLQSGSGQKSQCDLKGHWVSNVSLLFGSRIFYQSPYVLWHQLFCFLVAIRTPMI